MLFRAVGNPRAADPRKAITGRWHHRTHDTRLEPRKCVIAPFNLTIGYPQPRCRGCKAGLDFAIRYTPPRRRGSEAPLH